MAGLTFMIIIAIAIVDINLTLGFDTFTIGIFTSYLPIPVIPVLIFLIAAFVAFISANLWGFIMISLPVFVPLAFELGLNPAILIAAMLSGVSLGSQCCVYSDAVFMTAGGTGVPNITQIRIVLPYMCIGVVLASIAYIILGFTL